MILFNTSCGIYSILKESKYTAVFLSINNKTQCVPLLFCHRDLSHMLRKGAVTAGKGSPLIILNEDMNDKIINN